MPTLTQRALAILCESSDELGHQDALVGDGDLGITVTKGARAVMTALDQQPEDADLGNTLLVAATAFGGGNPSTFAALAQGALIAAAKQLRGTHPPLDAPQIRAMLAAAIESIEQRGKAQQGDKTVLDVLLASHAAIDEHDKTTPALIKKMAAAATAAAESLQGAPYRKGRASWVGARGIGVIDPGSLAYIRFLEALAQAMTGNIEEPANELSISPKGTNGEPA